MREMVTKYKHFSYLLFFAFTGMIFGYCEKFLTPRIIVYSRLDSYIPFIKEALIPYLFWYVYIAGAIIYLGFTSKIDFHRLNTFIVTAMIISIVVYVLFPNQQTLRPIITDNDIFSRILRFIYTVDTPTNVCPSIHVLNSIAVHAALVNSNSLKNNKVIKSASLIAMLSISFSTVFVKQHSILDVFLGGIIGLIIYIGIYLVPNPLYLGRIVNSQESDIVSE